MKVRIIAYTPKPDAVVTAAVRVCNSPLGGNEITNELQQAESEQLINDLISAGNHSHLEHISFTFAIDEVSRALSHQLVRHRIGTSFSQKSQRFVKEVDGQNSFIVPPSIESNAKLKLRFDKACAELLEIYEEFKQDIPQEDARYILPNATATNLVVTMNARSLLHFFELRCCQRAQWEIRQLAETMLDEVRVIAPIIFENAGSTCRTMGICFEDKYSCGRCKDVRSRI